METRVVGRGRGRGNRGGWRGAAPWVTAVAVSALPAAGGLEAQESRSLSGDRVAVYVPAGEVRVERGTGTSVEVEIRLLGPDASRLRLETGELGGRNALVVRYPEGEDIVYPAMRGNSNLSMRSDGTFGGRGGDRIRISRSGRGIEAWAEAVVRMPEGRDVQVRVGGGTIEARQVSGTLRLATGPGSVVVEEVQGDLEVAVGSGELRARGVEGTRVSLTTGSGSVEAGELTGEEVRITTGSGSIRSEGITAADLDLQTGSGRIELEGAISGTAEVRTGSGSVTATLATSPSDLRVHTGSGGVTLRLPPSVGAEVEARTGSGGIEVELPATSVTARRGHFRGVVGDGSGRIRITTGSGGVRLRGS